MKDSLLYVYFMSKEVDLQGGAQSVYSLGRFEIKAILPLMQPLKFFYCKMICASFKSTLIIHVTRTWLYCEIIQKSGPSCLCCTLLPYLPKYSKYTMPWNTLCPNFNCIFFQEHAIRSKAVRFSKIFLWIVSNALNLFLERKNLNFKRVYMLNFIWFIP